MQEFKTWLFQSLIRFKLENVIFFVIKFHSLISNLLIILNSTNWIRAELIHYAIIFTTDYKSHYSESRLQGRSSATHGSCSAFEIGFIAYKYSHKTSMNRVMKWKSVKNLFSNEFQSVSQTAAFVCTFSIKSMRKMDKWFIPAVCSFISCNIVEINL